MNILDRHRRLKSIGKALLNSEVLSDEDRIFIGTALVSISDGDDAATQLNIKVGKGKSSYKSARNREFRDKAALAWIAAAMAPLSEDGLGLTLDEAMEKLANQTAKEKIFGLDVDTIEKYWNDRPNQRSRDFNSSD